jgi:hypothetical protein
VLRQSHALTGGVDQLTTSAIKGVWNDIATIAPFPVGRPGVLTYSLVHLHLHDFWKCHDQRLGIRRAFGFNALQTAA